MASIAFSYVAWKGSCLVVFEMVFAKLRNGMQLMVLGFWERLARSDACAKDNPDSPSGKRGKPLSGSSHQKLCCEPQGEVPQSATLSASTHQKIQEHLLYHDASVHALAYTSNYSSWALAVSAISSRNHWGSNTSISLPCERSSCDGSRKLGEVWQWICCIRQSAQSPAGSERILVSIPVYYKY